MTGAPSVRKAAIFVMLLAISGCGPELDAERLQQRCAESSPSWTSFEEDLKASVGATPVALWQGEPVAVEMEEEGIQVEFALEGAWATLNTQLPILLRLPSGEIFRNSAAKVDFSTPGAYFFAVGVVTNGNIPWVELRYPQHEQRIPLDAAGGWRTRRYDSTSVEKGEPRP